MLKRLLASIALASLALTVVLLVYWWRSNHGHSDEFTLGKSSPTQSRFISEHGHVELEVTQNLGQSIVTTLKPYDFRNLIGYCLIVPGLWLAIWIRSFLPRPPGRELTAGRSKRKVR